AQRGKWSVDKGAMSEIGNSIPPRPTLVGELRRVLRLRHVTTGPKMPMSGWFRRLHCLSRNAPLQSDGPPEISAFLSSLASERGGSASTQNQALYAILFLY